MILTALGTLTARDRHALVTRHDSLRGAAAEMTTPASKHPCTLTTTARRSVVTPVDIEAARAQVDDCPFGMLEPHEVVASPAFSLDDQWLGSAATASSSSGTPSARPLCDLIDAVAKALARPISTRR